VKGVPSRVGSGYSRLVIKVLVNHGNLFVVKENKIVYSGIIMMLEKNCTNIVDFDIFFPFDPHWKNINSIRVSILNCISVLFDDYDKANAIAMVCAELLENAVKYGEEEGDTSSISCKLTGNEHEVTIEVNNRYTTTEDRLQHFFKTIDYLNSCEDPRKAYTDKLVQMYNDPNDASEHGGIGLYRIVYEGGFSLEYAIHDKTITITAKRAFTA
jgi:hypothetical protein